MKVKVVSISVWGLPWKIKKVDIFDSSKPLEVIDAEAIERTGLNNIGECIQ